MKAIQAEEAVSYYDDKNRPARSGSPGAALLLSGEEGSKSNYKMTLSVVESEYTTPRHRHNFEQVRYPINGNYVFTKDKVVPAGGIGYVTEGAYYGPQVQAKGLELMTLQFGGPGGSGYLSKRQRQEAYTELTAEGKFEKGIYTRIDEKGQRHNQDSYEAIWERANRRKIGYIEPRYSEALVMNPDSFSWREEDANAAVALKWLGTFTERETRIGFVRIDAEASCAFGLPDAPELLFLTRGAVSCQGKRYGRNSAFEIAPDDGLVEIKAVEPSEILRVQLPRF